MRPGPNEVDASSARKIPTPRARRTNKAPDTPPGYRFLTIRQVETDQSLTAPGTEVRVPFPGDFREGVIRERYRGYSYLVMLATGGMVTCNLRQFVVRDPRCVEQP